MITIIHGDNTVLSRQQLTRHIEGRTRQGKTVKSIAGADISLPSLTSALQSTSLFGDEQAVVLERLFKMRSKNVRDQVVQILVTHQETEVILWDDHIISATNLKLISAAKPSVELFKTSPIVFQTMDMFGNPHESSRMIKQLHRSYDQDTTEFVFSMLARQVRLLISVVEGDTGSMKPYTLQKVSQQAKHFTLEKLLKIHHQLLVIDLNQKQSLSLLTLEQQLDMLALQSAT